MAMNIYSNTFKSWKFILYYSTVQLKYNNYLHQTGLKNEGRKSVVWTRPWHPQVCYHDIVLHLRAHLLVKVMLLVLLLNTWTLSLLQIFTPNLKFLKNTQDTITYFWFKLTHSVFSAVIVIIRFFFYCMSINGPAKRSFLYGDEMNGSGNGLLSLGFLES